MEKIEFEFKCLKIPTINRTYYRTNEGIFKNKDVKIYQTELANFGFIFSKKNNNLFNKNLEVNLTFKVQNANRDLDNMIKATLDGLQGILFHNDSQILKLVCLKTKSSDNFEYVKVIIKEFNENK